MSSIHHDRPDRERTVTPLVSLLVDPRRRAALEYLTKRDSSISLDELAAAVAARESDGTDDGASVDEVVAALHHVHLPKLAAFGMIEYDADRNVVTGVRTDAPPLSAGPQDRPA